MNSPISHKRKRANEKGIRTISMRIRLLWGTTLSFFSSISDVYMCVCGQTNATFKYKPAKNQKGSVADKTDAFYALRPCSLLCPSYATYQWTQRLSAELKPRMRVWDISAVPFSKACLNLSIWTQPRTWLLTTAKAKFPLPRSVVLKNLPYEVQIQGHTVGHVPHTDIGSLSKVFSNMPGLQV